MRPRAGDRGVDEVHERLRDGFESSDHFLTLPAVHDFAMPAEERTTAVGAARGGIVDILDSRRAGFGDPAGSLSRPLIYARPARHGR